MAASKSADNPSVDASVDAHDNAAATASATTAAEAQADSVAVEAVAPAPDTPDDRADEDANVAAAAARETEEQSAHQPEDDAEVPECNDDNQQQQQQHQQEAADAGAKSDDSRHASSTDGEQRQEVRTLFLSGLPHDVKERELHLLFRVSEGFEGASINYTGKQPVAFAVFSSQPNALAARDELNGFQFDIESPITLRIELAKSNSKAKRNRGSPQHSAASSYASASVPAFYPDSLKQHQTHAVPPRDAAPAGARYGVDAYPGNGMYITHGSEYWPGHPGATAASYGSMMSFPNAGHVDAFMLGAGQRGQASPPPCSTLFVANLGHNINEEELHDAFARTPGFRRMRMLHNQKDSGPVAFIEYSDVVYSTQAMHQMQDYKLESSDRTSGLRIEFAKNRMGTQAQQAATAAAIAAMSNPATYARRAMMPTSPNEYGVPDVLDINGIGVSRPMAIPYHVPGEY